MKNGLYFFCFLILSTTLFTACGASSAEVSIVGVWNLESVDGQPLPQGKQIVFEFKADGIVSRKLDGVEVEDQSQWSIKEDQETKTRFLHIIDLEDTNVKEQFKIEKLDATTFIFLDGQETITLIKQI